MREQPNSRGIIHLDMDAFYPAVELLDNPALKGKPVIVGGSRERGVVCSASYEARKFGVHSAQPMATAVRLCPEAVVLPVRMSRYKEVSHQVFRIFRTFTPLVEPLSIDEAFLDVTGCLRLFGHPVLVAKMIKERVRQEVGLTVSAGIAPCKFVAKIASDLNKPDGLTVVPPEQVRQFLSALPIEKMWGVGKATQEKLEVLGIRTIGQLGRMPADFLERKFGKNGIAMHRLAAGIDEREVVPFHDMKSVGHEDTFDQDITELKAAKKELMSLAGKVARRMRREKIKGRTITLKVKYGDFRTITRSTTLSESTDDGFEIYEVACRLLRKTDVGKRPTRLLGIALSQLSHKGQEDQLSLFGERSETRKRESLNAALDALYEKFGDHSILPGTLLTE